MSAWQRIREAKPSTRWAIFAAVAALAVIITALLPRIPVPPAYHHFADKRPLFGVPNGGDVLSNLAFALSGSLGFWFALRRVSPLIVGQKWAYGTMFAGLFLTAFGSAYYHLAPDNQRLVWDRLPMILVMAGLVSALLVDRFGKIGASILPLTTGIGILSVIIWGLSEERGQGDVRWYSLYQGMVMIAAVALLIMFPSRQPGTREFVIAAFANASAKVFELLDKPIFWLGGVVSGHTLKHLSAGLGFLPLVWLLKHKSSEEVLTTKDTK